MIEVDTGVEHGYLHPAARMRAPLYQSNLLSDVVHTKKRSLVSSASLRPS